MFGSVRDQGRRPTCLAFAVSDLHAAMRKRSVFEELSVEYAFYRASLRQGLLRRDSGTAIKPMLEALEFDGQPQESSWPYLQALPIDLGSYTPPTIDGQLFRTRGSQLNLTLTDTADRLTHGFPLMLGILPSLQFHTAVGTSVIVRTSPDPLTGAAHAVIAVGWGEFGNQKAFLLRNSWGPKWGNRGYVWASEEYLNPRLITAVTMEAQWKN
jgi:hypothetical protein